MKFLATLFVTLASFTVLAGSVSAQTRLPANAAACRAVIASTKAPLVREMRTVDEPMAVTREAQEWNARFEAVRTAKDLSELIAKIDKKESKKDLGKADFQALQNIDLVQIIAGFPPVDRTIALEIAEKAARRFENGSFDSTDLMLYPVSFVSQPARAVRFAKRLPWYANTKRTMQTDYAGKSGLSVISRSLISALMQLPPATRAAVESEFHSQIQSIDLKDEITTKDANGRFRAPVSRKHRRNVEFILNMMTRGELYTLERAMMNAHDTNELVQAVDDYFASLDRVMAPARGNYSFRRALEIAEILQLRFRPYLTDGAYMDIYGSLGNGKATIATSDVDVKFSMKLLGLITGQSPKRMAEQPGSPLFADMIKRNWNVMPMFGRNFWRTYLATEEEIARTSFNRKVDIKSDTLTSFFPPMAHLGDSTDSLWYNPIQIRVMGDRIEVQIVDLIAVPQRTYVFSYRP